MPASVSNAQHSNAFNCARKYCFNSANEFANCCITYHIKNIAISNNLKLRLFFYVVGNIVKRKLVCRFEAVFPPVPKYIAFTISKNVLTFMQLYNLNVILNLRCYFM